MDLEALLPKRPCCAGDAAHPPLSSLPPSRATGAGAMAGASGSPGSVDRLLEAFLGISGGSSVAVELSVERLVDSRALESEKNRVIESAMRLGAALMEGAKRSARKLATKHNSSSWPLPPDLTTKVFSMLDTQSVCHAAATCSMFNKCANDPVCYANVDLTSLVPKINNAVVCTMVQRAGKNLRVDQGSSSSPPPRKKEKFIGPFAIFSQSLSQKNCRVVRCFKKQPSGLGV